MGAVVTFFVSLTLAITLSMDVTSEVELSQFNLYLTASSGATLEQTDALTVELEKLLDGIPEIKDVVTNVYEGEASLTIVLKDDFEDIDNRSITMIKDDIDDRIDDFPPGAGQPVRTDIVQFAIQQRRWRRQKHEIRLMRSTVCSVWAPSRNPSFSGALISSCLRMSPRTSSIIWVRWNRSGRTSVSIPRRSPRNSPALR